MAKMSFTAEFTIVWDEKSAMFTIEGCEVDWNLVGKTLFFYHYDEDDEGVSTTKVWQCKCSDELYDFLTNDDVDDDERLSNQFDCICALKEIDS